MADSEETSNELEDQSQEHVATTDDEVATDREGADVLPFTYYRPTPRELTDEEKVILEDRKAHWQFADPMDVLHTVLQKEPYDRIGRQTLVVRAIAFLIPSAVIITAGFLTSGATQGALFMVGSAILGVQLAEPFKNLSTWYREYAEEAKSQRETVLQRATTSIRFKLTGPAYFSPVGGIYLRQGKRRWLRFRLNRLDRQYERWVEETMPGQVVGVDTAAPTALIRLPAGNRWTRWRTRRVLKRTEKFLTKLRDVIYPRYGLPEDTNLLAPTEWRGTLVGRKGTLFPLNEDVYKEYCKTMKRLAMARESHES